VRRTARTRRFFRLAPFLLLGVENLAVFDRHYFEGYGFPWDFVGSYYAAVAYWTEAMTHGGLPMWMPFQWMGYPFLLNLQTGLWYPPMWVFPLLRIPYTLHAAVVLQCLHVFAGALGMYALLRATVRSRREALLGAFAFQLFGGFYSNAEHVDIVRSFAMLPWLFWTAVPPAADDARLPRRLLLAPLVLYLFAVGGYPGNLIAAIFLLSVFTALVLVQRRFGRMAVTWAAALGASGVLGIAMATIHLGPAWVFRAELQRYNASERISMNQAALSVGHLPGLVLETAGVPGEISMRSTFVGLAVLAGVALLAWPSLRRFWPWAALGVFAASMAAGDSLPVHPFLRTLAPPLGYSRFPSSDYRGVVAVVLVLLAAAGWRDVRRRGESARALTWRLIPIALFAGWAADRIYAGQPFWPRPALSATVFLASAAAILVWRESPTRPAVAFLAMLAAISLGAALVLPRVDGWIVPDLIATCRIFSPTPARMHDAGVVVAPAVFATPPASRPARTEGDGRYLASGYLTGTYDVGDFGGSVLRARKASAKNGTLLAFMRREWLPILVESPPRPEVDEIVIADLTARAAAAAPDPRVRQTSYGLDRVRYRVSTDRPLLLVENEIYFPGWTARVGGDDLDSVRVNGGFRGWQLPAGSYELDTVFLIPHLRGLALTTAVAWAVWLVLVVPFWRRLG